MRKLFLVGIMSYLALTSCKNDENKVTTTVSNYFPLSVGNYWIYNVYQQDLKTSKDSLIGADSLYIKKDTVIKNQKYCILSEKPVSQNLYSCIAFSVLRDSVNCVLEISRDTVYTFLNYANFTDTMSKWHYDIFDPEIKSGYVKQYKLYKPFEVPVGRFNDIIDKRQVLITAKKSICEKDSMISNQYFANNIGLVYFNMIFTGQFLNCSYRTDYKLVRYKIN